MAIDVKEIIIDSFLKINETKPISKITIKDILTQSKVSRQTFYNHFIDKNDLIQYIYLYRIIPDYNQEGDMVNFRQSLEASFDLMIKYKKFLKEACLEKGQNNLSEFILQHCKEYDLKWHQSLYGSKPMPEELRFATEYHAIASSSMTLSWIVSDMPISPKEMANMIVSMRSVGMDQLFVTGEHGNPYK